MNIISELLDDHQVRLKVEVDSEQLERAKRLAARKIAQRTKIPGFRPGKAPYAIVERMVGDAAILEQALESLVDDIYPQVIEESNIEPYGPGSLEDFHAEDNPVFEFLVPLSPQVTLGDYRSIRIPYVPEELTDQDVAEALEQLQDGQALIEPVDRPAQDGDVVFITLRADRTQASTEDSPVLVPEQHLNILLTSSQESQEGEWPFPGFSQHLVGMKSGDEKTIRHVFPEDDESESMRGVESDFFVVVDEVKSRSLPELNDELAQSIGDFETLEDLRAYIRQVLEERNRREYNENYDDQILERLNQDSTIKYPPQMLDREINVVRDQLVDRLAGQNLDLNTYLKSRQMDAEQLTEELKPVAEERLRRGLLLMEVAEVENIQVDPKEVEGEASRTIDQLYQVMSQREARRKLTGDVVRGLVGQIMSEKMAQQTVQLLRTIARGDQEQDDPAQNGDEESAESKPVDGLDEPAETETVALETASPPPSAQPSQAASGDSPATEEPAEVEAQSETQ